MVFDTVGFALYADDRALSDALLAGVGEALGESTFGAQQAAGRTLGRERAVALADEVFGDAIARG